MIHKVMIIDGMMGMSELMTIFWFVI